MFAVQCAYIVWFLAAVTVLALVMFLPVFTEYFRTGLVPRFPTLIVSGFVMIAAIQAFFSGLVLETINRKNRQDFELELIRVQKMAQQQ